MLELLLLGLNLLLLLAGELAEGRDDGGGALHHAHVLARLLVDEERLGATNPRVEGHERDLSVAHDRVGG